MSGNCIKLAYVESKEHKIYKYLALDGKHPYYIWYTV